MGYVYFLELYFSTVILSTQPKFANNPVNSQNKFISYLLNPTLCYSWISFHKTKIRDYPPGSKPDLKTRKAFIYLSYYTLIYLPLTSIRPSQRAAFAGTGPLAGCCLRCSHLRGITVGRVPL